MLKKNFYLLLTITTIFLFTACKPKVIQTTEEGATVDQLMNLKEGEKLVAVVETNMGTIDIELFAKQTPKTVQNFAALAAKGYYNNLIFHRVIKDFMIQGGDPTGTGAGGESIYGKKFDDEIVPSLRHNDAGMLSMANAGPNTNGSQFFITVIPTPWLDGRHTVFGKVVSGMNVVYDISKVKTNQSDKPVEKVVMQKVIIEKRAG